MPWDYVATEALGAFFETAGADAILAGAAASDVLAGGAVNAALDQAAQAYGYADASAAMADGVSQGSLQQYADITGLTGQGVTPFGTSVSGAPAANAAAAADAAALGGATAAQSANAAVAAAKTAGITLSAADLAAMGITGLTAADYAKLGVAGLGAIAPALANYAGASGASNAAQQAAAAQTQFGREALAQQNALATQSLDLQKTQFDKQQANMAPYVAAGTAALPQLTAGVAPGGQFNKPYTLADFQAGPQAGLYDFAKGEALSALGNRAAAGGAAQNTGTTVAAGKLAGNLANQYYNTGFGQNLQTNNMALTGLENVVNTGYGATGAANTSSGAYANAGTGTLNSLASNTSNQLGALGNIAGAGIIGAQSPYTNATTQLGQSVGQFANTAAGIPNAMNTLANLFA
jgi:hypothetical protein